MRIGGVTISVTFLEGHLAMANRCFVGGGGSVLIDVRVPDVVNVSIPAKGCKRLGMGN